jgi:outer membrane protein OmpA-like peptidoglycan-associated protein
VINPVRDRRGVKRRRLAGGFAGCVAGCVAAFAATVAGQPPVGAPVSFLACPIARDTGPDTDVCFLAEHEGRLYALGNPPDFGAPQLKHRVLVEGRIADAAAACGALPLVGRVSVMAEIDQACDVILPFDGVIKGAAGGVFNSGSAEQRAAAQELARRVALDPRLSVEPAILDPAPAPLPTPPFEPRTLVIWYPFDSDRGPGPDMVKLRELAIYAREAKARGVEISGYRAVSRLSDGTQLVERAFMAEARARKIAAILEGIGVGPRLLKVRWERDAIGGTGDEDWKNRKVEVTVRP